MGSRFIGLLHECVLAIKELHESHGGAHMAKVLHEVLVDNYLTDKVRIFLFLHNFVYSILVLYSCA